MAVTQYQSLVRQCLLKRTLPAEFSKLLLQKDRLNAKGLVFALIDCQQGFCASGDPLPPRYLEALLSAHVVDLSDVLVVAITRWNSQKTHNRQDTTTLQELGWLLLSNKIKADRTETKKCLMLSAKWLTAIVQYSGQLDAPEADLSTLAEAVGSLLATLSATNVGIEILSSRPKTDGGDQDALTVVGNAVDAVIASVPDISIQLADRLSVVKKHIEMVQQGHTQPGNNEQDDFETAQFKQSLPEVEVIASQHGTFVYLDAMLSATKTIDDQTLFTFLEGRHNQSYALMFSDLLSSSFLVLSKASGLDRNNAGHTQIFICNKVPNVLSLIASSSFSTFNSESAVIEAWPRIRLGLTTTELARCGQHFLQACSLLQLISEKARNELQGSEDSVVAPTSQLLTKEDVVAQVNNGQLRLSDLVNRLLDLSGSAAAVAQAIVEIIMTYSSNKEPHHLKDIANALVRKPGTINSLALFVPPSYWLSPLCTLLDDWRWDEIHGESQPLYDEFGSILLCITLAKRRLSLIKAELGIGNAGGFVSKYLDQEGTDMALEDLTEESKGHLGEWIKALYVDEGLNDELTTSCSPQAFYLFLPTLLRQSLLALQNGILGRDTLKSGLGFLLEPFLMPSLVSALLWIHKTSDREARQVILPILVETPSGEAKDIHQTITQTIGPSSAFSSERQGAGKPSDLSKRLSAAVESSTTPTSLSASLDFHCQVVGVEESIKVMIEVLLRVSGTPNFQAALDVLAILVCTADRQLRDALRLAFARLGKLLEEKKRPRAEIIVHLYRRVEAYASVLMTTDLHMDQFATLNLRNIEAVAANMNVSVVPAPEVQQLDQPMDDIDQVLNESVAMNSLEQIDTNTLTMDDYYGEMGNLDDLDLEMFS